MWIHEVFTCLQFWMPLKQKAFLRWEEVQLCELLFATWFSKTVMKLVQASVNDKLEHFRRRLTHGSQGKAEAFPNGGMKMRCSCRSRSVGSSVDVNLILQSSTSLNNRVAGLLWDTVVNRLCGFSVYSEMKQVCRRQSGSDTANCSWIRRDTLSHSQPHLFLRRRKIWVTDDGSPLSYRDSDFIKGLMRFVFWGEGALMPSCYI